MGAELAGKNPPARSLGKCILLTLPIALWGLLMFTPALRSHPKPARVAAALVTITFMAGLFFMMMRTGATYRWRRYFFVAVGFLFPIGFIAGLIGARGTMSIPISPAIRRSATWSSLC